MSDNGTQIISKEFKTFEKQYYFNLITPSQQDTQSNGLIEHMM